MSAGDSNAHVRDNYHTFVHTFASFRIQALKEIYALYHFSTGKISVRPHALVVTKDVGVSTSPPTRLPRGARGPRRN